MSSLPSVLAVARLDRIDAASIGAALRSHRPDDVDGLLVIAPLAGEAIVLGAHQRARSTIDLAETKLTIARRSTGGPAIEVGEGQLFVGFALARADLFGGVADPNRALNRHLRPLLRALTSLGITASYGGRDFITSRGAPIAWCGLRHRIDDATIGLEIILSLTRAFALDPSLDLADAAIVPRWLGRTPTTIAEALAPSPSLERITEAIIDAYGAAADRVFDTTLQLADPPTIRLDEAPFDAMTEVPIGLLGATRDAYSSVSVGGDWMVSDDAHTRLDAALATLPLDADDEAIGHLIDQTLGPASGAMLIGVPRLDAVRKVITHARQK